MKPRRKAGLDCRYRASRGLFPRDSDTSKPPASSLSSLFPLSLQVFNSTIDGGDQFMVPLALGPSLFGSQHVGELGQQVAFFLPNEHGVNFFVCLYQWLSCAPSREAGVRGRRGKGG